MTDNQKSKRIYLSPPHLDGRERTLLLEAYDSNWITTLGPQVDAFERELCERFSVHHATAQASGTATLHLSLMTLGVKQGDEVLCFTVTFSATANAIVYCGASPVFFVVVNTGARLDDHCTLNVGTTVSHDTKIGRFNNLNPGVHLAGNVIISEGCYIGMGANVIKGVSIGPWTVVGAGSVVIRDLPGNVTAVGNPVDLIKTRKEGVYEQ